MKSHLLFLFIVMGIVFLDLTLSDAHAQTQDSIVAYVSMQNHGETSIGNYFLPGEQIEFIGNVLDNTKHVSVSGATVDLTLTCPNGTTTKMASTTSGSDGGFSITVPVTNGFDIGDYVVNVYAHKDGYADGNGDSPAFFLVARGGKQIIKAEGQDFPVYLEGIELQTDNLTFNKDTKSLTFNIKKIEGGYVPKGISWIGGRLPYINQIFVTFKKPLISAPFHVFVNNQEIQIDNSENKTYYFLDLPLLDSDASGKGHVVMVGTYAVPEFPFSVPVLLIGIVSAIGFYGMKFRK